MNHAPKFLRTFVVRGKEEADTPIIVHLDTVDSITPHSTEPDQTKIHWREDGGTSTIREKFHDLDVVLAIHGLSMETPKTQERRRGG